ncbi:MAG: DUF6505 family protein [Hyphomicrobiales bacterium]|nr:DUF6505 family protein [Hyphomicrobiales bacterium]
MAVKLLRAIRLDPSDTFVFAKPAEPDEWLVSGAFLFDAAAVEALDPKARVAFRSGFLGVRSFGFSTLASVSLATADDMDAAARDLAAGLMRVGAPDMDAAHAAAREELAFAASLADHPPGTLVAAHRAVENGEIVERFRTLTPRPDMNRGGFRAFEFVEDDEPGDNVRLSELAETKP